jgi:stage IV sporulation protein FB
MKKAIPVRISPFFWVIAGVIGYINSRTLWGTVMWIVVILVSILIHEYGHAITSKMFGQTPRIELIAFGGLTYPAGKKITKGKEFLVVLMGPAFGFGLFLIASGILTLSAITANAYAFYFFKILQLVNLFWTILNLVPVMPLDGGQLMRIIFEVCSKKNGMRYAMGSSIVIGVIAAVFFLFLRFYIVGVLFFILGFQNIMMWKQMRHFKAEDRDDSLQKELEKGEVALESGHEDKALSIFEKLHSKAGSGMIQLNVCQYLAQLYYRKGRSQDAYDLLMPLRPKLTADALLLLHHLAYQLKDYSLVIELSADTFQIEPCMDVALHNALACASQNHADAATGWLRTSIKHGLQDVQKIVQNEAFDPIRNDPTFLSFLKAN